MASAYHYLDNVLPDKSRLGINGEWLITNWDYLFFGPELKRQVVFVDLSSKRIDLNTFESENIDYLLISAKVAQEMEAETPLWPVISNHKTEWYLAKRNEAELFANSSGSYRVYEESFGEDYRAFIQIQRYLDRTQESFRILSNDPRIPFYTNDQRWEFKLLSDFTELENYTHLVIAPWWTASDYERIGLSYEDFIAFLQKDKFVKKIFESNGYELYQLQF
jgi:hypothetical protein